MTDILVATHNGGKVKEIGHLLHLDQVHLLTMGDVHLHDFNVEESGLTYEDNAILKAKTIGDKTRHITIADDSGIEVEALGWRPGVHSARFAKGSDRDRCQTLLKQLEGKQNRRARFVCVVVWYHPGLKIKHVFTGKVTGQISNKIEGTGGFGYDPIFIPSGYTQSMAMLGEKIKNKISHRAKAISQLRAFLLT